MSGFRCDRYAAGLLRLLLEQARYAHVQSLLRANVLSNPFCDPLSGASILHAIKDLPPLQVLMVRLFTLGEGVPLEEIGTQLDREDFDCLAGAGLLLADGERIRSRFLVISYLNRLFLVSPPLWMRGYEPDEVHVYVGPDSYWVARFAANLGPADRALDLGSGSGLLASLVDARSTVAVEFDPAVSEVARFNTVLNALDGRIQVLTGNLYEVLDEDERFDLIVANPPFIPAPDGLSLPASGDGGPDGNEVMRTVIAGLCNRLNLGGRALIYGESFGDEREPSITPWLREQASSGGLGGSLYINDVRSLEAAGERLRRLWQATGATEGAAFSGWNRLCEDKSLARHYTYLIDVGLGGRGQLATRRVQRL